MPNLFFPTIVHNFQMKKKKKHIFLILVYKYAHSTAYQLYSVIINLYDVTSEKNKSNFDLDRLDQIQIVNFS